jgi:hypothetical protein
MSRILDSMRTRVVKLALKIKPLVEERDALMKAIAALETTTPPSPPHTDITPASHVDVSKEEHPHFLKKQA